MSLMNLACQFSRLKRNILRPETNFRCFKAVRCPLNTTSHISNQQESHEPGLSRNNSFTPFLQMMRHRKLEAEKSILVQVNSAQSYKELYTYCSTFGTVDNMFHYTVGIDPVHFIIVEFGTTYSIREILTNSGYVQNSEAVKIYSQFLWFKASYKKPKLNKLAQLTAENGNFSVAEETIAQNLHGCDSVSDQIVCLYNSLNLNEVATRLRFLTAKQIEMSLAGMFPNATAYPFGSSVNGFGKMGCDLDLVLRLSGEEGDHKLKEKQETRLVFHCKALNDYEKFLTVRQMEVIGDVLQLFLPGCSQVRKILQARVPIIKYYQQFTDVECDLSMSNMSGVCMSDLLYIFGSIDQRVRPLIFTVRRWAYEVGLTNSSPGRWITNFSLTLLVLAFFQAKSILPTIDVLYKSAEPSDKYVTEEGINCTFLRDINKLHFRTKNTQTLEELLKEFCEYYSTFDYKSNAVNLNSSVPIMKPDYSPLYIVNPLEKGLNVSKNVSLEELEKFRFELRNAAWILESYEDKQNWGLLQLFHSTKKKFGQHFIVPSTKSRLMEVSKIFEESDEANVEVAFKNKLVEKQIDEIKKETQKTLNNLHSQILSKSTSR